MKVAKRPRKGGEAWVVDWYDFGQRRVRAFPTKRDAEDFKADLRQKQKQRLQPKVNAQITVRDFALTFLDRCRGLDIKPRTVERYESALRVHILPALGDKRVRELDRPTVEQFVLGKRTGENESRQGQKGEETSGRRKLARGTVLHLLMTLSAVMHAAVAVQLLVSNPLSGLTKDLRLSKRKKGDKQKVKAFDQPQLARFLTVARQIAPDVFPAFAVMALEGLRVGEAMALKWASLDLAEKRVHVTEQISGTTKDGDAREIEMADALHQVLTALLTRRRAEAFRKGRPVSPYALFPEFSESVDRKAEQRVVKRIRARMQSVLRVAGLPPHHTPHSLRHSFASILISKGRPIAYVQQALGHESISMTVDTYGSWLPVEAPGAVNVLAEGLDLDRPVTEGASTGNIANDECPQALAMTGTSSPRLRRLPRSPCTCI
jgi:integrase